MTARILFPILLTSVNLCTASDANVDHAYASASLSLLRAAAPESSSFVFSPLSLIAALAVLHEGANDVARKELQNILLPGRSSEELTKFYSELLKTVLSESAQQSLLMATRLFVRDTYKLDQKFIDQTENEYHVGLESANFSDALGSSKIINDFIATNTKNRIKDIVKEADVRSAVLFLVNALSFTAPWEHKFEANEKRTFNGIAGKLENVEFMAAKHSFDYHETSSAQVLSISYKRNYPHKQPFSFTIILPKVDQDFKKFKKNLSPKAFHSLLTGVKYPEREVNALIPKFSIESKMEAAEVLQKLGVHAIFSPGNLKKIANDPTLHVSDVKHQAVLKIHENGTDAAAISLVGLAGSAMPCEESPIPFIADRPFLFALVAERKHPVFLGQYV